MRIKFIAIAALSFSTLLTINGPLAGKPIERGNAAHSRKPAAMENRSDSRSQRRQSSVSRSQSPQARHNERQPNSAVRSRPDDGNVNVRHIAISAARHRPMFGWPALVTEANKYLGTNPTKRSRLWCATFMNMVLNEVGYAGTGSDAARSFASYGRRINGPKIGSIAVLTRGKRGGHVGVVTGVDRIGNPIIISGNHGRKVGIGVYPKRRVIAYVMPVGNPQPTRYAMASQAQASPRATDAASKRRNDGGGVSSPITELLAAIETDRPVDNRSAAQLQPQVQQARLGSRRPVEPAPAPHRVVQQMADNEVVRVNYVRPLPAVQQIRAVPPRRELPLDPALARFLGMNKR